ncbi:MAG: hypothetical protein COB30_013615 [Ectothiorhodospiraceae bacterium]|nr:hypothetical protein [Ectothiorhodospiraceae bacterium]
MTYPIITVPNDASNLLEQLGTKSKFWFLDPDKNKILYKEGRPGTGENWAEKVSCEICKLLHLPHAEYDFAIYENRKGVISPTFSPSGCRLILGNEVLAHVIEDYGDERHYRERQHTVNRVMAVVKAPHINFPMGWNAPNEINSAADIFVGYLMLDVLISNQDRHHENWGLIDQPEYGLFLAPTFDHASSLGRNESDEKCLERLNTNDTGRGVEVFVRRAKSALYAKPNDSTPLSTLGAFLSSAKIAPSGAKFWLNKLAQFSKIQCDEIFNQIPKTIISEPSKSFAVKMIEANKNRLLNSEF